ncbi:FtsW/RodA/SpoVE family cell cycle protein [Nesterenkonia aerolata]|uniref:FtsW/RodA/SpoVE family cell cycle protein n=1 Tax=Nesterenkonia aerolata TaxID=3074079 RepID=A0ABU2DUC5_9MICC|nr:FtsW/RodA/SpoVE family cell cycle protein [Nesterenkonia sp. LY-0111]MDR8020094.1 FtsW/RodA/SpoVE family cell cycle protein [Nesterenkonia sp. LY-0111]
MSQTDVRPPTRRNLELFLLLIALTIAVGSQIVTAAAMDAPIEESYYLNGAIYSALVLAFHVVLRVRAKYADPFILPIVVTLNGLGIAMIHRLDLSAGDGVVADRQLLWSAVSMAIAMVLLWFLQDHRRLRQLTYLSLLVGTVLLFLPMLPGIGMEINGARIWVNLGFASFQPSELAKIALGVFFAGFLANNRDLILLAGRKIGPLQFPRIQDLAPLMIGWLVAIGVLVVQTDLGNSIMFFGLFMAMIYVATSRLSWIVIGMLLVAAGALLAWMFVPHVAARVDIWLNAFDEDIYSREFGGSEQVVQGMFGLANGGLTGTGLGSGMPNRVPLANSDMILAAFGEELGLIGLTAMLLLYLLLFSRFMRAGLGTRDAFGKLLAVGFAVMLVLQIFVVLGGITRVIPMTGLTAPFLAAGGSSLLGNWLIVAIVLLISHSARRPIVVGPMVNASGDAASGIENPTAEAAETGLSTGEGADAQARAEAEAATFEEQDEAPLRPGTGGGR